MYDAAGDQLPRIAGMRGVRARSADGTMIGCDFIRMQPGSQFPLHRHAGDHEIYFIQGAGFVHIGGTDIAVSAGHVIHIPAEYPHAVRVAETASCALIFAAVGHPHIHVDAADRMQAPR